MKSIQIPKSLIAHYLGKFVDSIRMSDEGDIYNEELINECFNHIKYELLKFNEQTHLASGLKSLTENTPTEEYMDYSNQEESLTDEDMAYIVGLMLKKTMPLDFDRSLTIEITAESLDDFRIGQGAYYKAEENETLESIARKTSIPLSTILDKNPFLARKYSSKNPLPVGTTFPLETPNPIWKPTQF